MNCHECQDLLQRRLDGDRVSASADLELHLSSCPTCRRNQAAAGLLLEGLKGLPRTEPRVDFADQIVAAVLHDRVRRRLRMRRRVWLTASLAAAILLMAWAGNLWLPNHRSDNAPPPFVEHKEPKENKDIKPVDPLPVPTPAIPHFAQAVDEARDAVFALTERVAGETREQAKLFIAAAPTDVSGLTEKVRNMGDPPMQEPLEPATQSLLQAGQGVSQGIQTVAGSAFRAVDFFSKELPVLDGVN